MFHCYLRLLHTQNCNKSEGRERERDVRNCKYSLLPSIAGLRSFICVCVCLWWQKIHWFLSLHLANGERNVYYEVSEDSVFQVRKAKIPRQSISNSANFNFTPFDESPFCCGTKSKRIAIKNGTTSHIKGKKKKKAKGIHAKSVVSRRKGRSDERNIVKGVIK